jgi:hypothetical protein
LKSLKRESERGEEARESEARGLFLVAFVSEWVSSTFFKCFFSLSFFSSHGAQGTTQLLAMV